MTKITLAVVLGLALTTGIFGAILGKAVTKAIEAPRVAVVE